MLPTFSRGIPQWRTFVQQLLRGIPGLGQHGLPTLKAADLSCDMPLLAEARDAAQQLLAGDPLLTRPEHAVLRRRVQALFRQKDGSLN